MTKEDVECRIRSLGVQYIAGYISREVYVRKVSVLYDQIYALLKPREQKPDWICCLCHKGIYGRHWAQRLDDGFAHLECPP